MSPRSPSPPLTLVLGLLTLLTGAPARAERIEVASKPVPLNPSDPRQDKVGSLTYRGGLALTSSHPRFGGLSSLRLSEEGARITFVSDEGSWLTAQLVHDDLGHLVGLADAEPERSRTSTASPWWRRRKRTRSLWCACPTAP
jgi:hypothetical protein